MYTETKKSIKKHVLTAGRLLMANSDVEGASACAKACLEIGEVLDGVETEPNPNPRKPRNTTKKK